MSCPIHPQWLHDREDCPLCSANPSCGCVVKNREQMESQREWLKRWMCMRHWMETDYYQSKLSYNKFFYLDDKDHE